MKSMTKQVQGEELFVGIDLHKRRWHVTIRTADVEIFSNSIAGRWEDLRRGISGKTLRLKENNRRLRFLAEDKIQTLLDASPKYLRWIVECAIMTSMRRGEILNLKWDDIRNGFIYLEKTKTNEA